MNKGETKTENILKRILSLVIINVMLMSLFAPYSTNAASDLEGSAGPAVHIIFTVDGGAEAELIAGQDIDVEIILLKGSQEKEEQIAALEGTLNFDTSVLSFVSINTNLANWSATCDSNNFLTIQRESGEQYCGVNQGIATVRFHVEKTVPITTVGINDVYLVNKANNSSDDEPSLDIGNVSSVIPPATYSATFHYYNNLGEECTETLNNVYFGEVTEEHINLPQIQDKYTYIDTNNKTWTPIGWTAEETNTNNIITEDIITEHKINRKDFYMVYERDINVTYNTNGGSIAPTAPTGLKAKVNIFDITNIEGSQVTITSTTPTKDGYEFQNEWTTNPDGTGDSYTSGTTYTFTDDCTLYAKWNSNAYTIKYDGNGNDSTNTAMSDTSYIYNNELTGVDLSANTYTKSGYSFKGWSLTPSSTTATYTDSSTIPNADILANSNNNKEITLYAVWEKETYNITYVSDPVGLTLPSTNPSTYKASNGTITLTNPEIPGYTFTGWTDNNTITTPQATYQINGLSNDIEITAHFEAKEYTIIYDGNGNNTTDTNMANDSYTFASGGLTLKTNTYTKTGYTFKGWTTTSGGTSVEYANGVVISDTDILAKQTAQTVTLYAVWEADQNTPYTVEHYRQNANGSYPTTPNETESLTGTTGAQITATLKTTPEYVGYVEDQDYIAQKTGTIAADGSLVLKVYYKIAEYIVTFDVNGGDSLTNNTKTVKYGQTYGSMPTPTWTGHTFLGWFDSQTGGTKIEDTSIVTQTKDHILYANWDTNTYTVEFIGKKADGSPEGIDYVIKTVQVPHGNSIIPAQLGIDLEELKQTIRTPKYTYTVDTISPFIGDLTTPVTANRQIQINYNKTINSYTITFYNEGADPALDTPLGTDTVEYGNSASDAHINPVKQGDNTYSYQFTSWVDSNNNVDDLSNVITDRQVYATYTPVYKNYEVKFVDEDGTTEISKKSDYHYNDALIIPADPTKSQTDEYTYTFEGWVDSTDSSETIVNLNNTNVTENKIYKAKYTQTKRQYTITFLDKDKLTVLGTSTVDYGTSATAPNVTDKQDGVGYNYVFDKWVVDLDANPQVEANLNNVTQNTNVYATYTKTPISYKIKYEGTMDAPNSNPLTYTVEDADITLAPLGQKVGMEFKGWYTDTAYTTQIASIEISKMDKTNLNDITIYAKWDIKELMYFVKDSANKDNDTLAQDRIYDNFDNAKVYVDTLFDNGNGTALGIYDLNNDLVYFPEVEPKLYYVKANENVDNSQAIEYNDFDAAKTYVDNQFKAGTTIKIYDQNNKLIYEPKEETPKVQYFVKVNENDPNTDQNTFDQFSDAKIFADQNAENKVKVYDINGQIVYEPQEKLYLRSEKYKIGENKLDEYEENDLYLYRVNANTTLAEFKTSPNCITNGNITVYKQDGSTLKDNELVGTGMTLKDELNGQVITLLIAVTGDANGNGRIDTGDLTALRGDLYEGNKLQGIYLKAMDIDENESIKTKDLTLIRGALYEGKTL